MPQIFFMLRTRSNRVLWTLYEIGAPFESPQITGPERRGDDHLARHPLGRVPALTLDDSTTMFESAAICLQLGDLHPESGLMPPLGSSARALVYQWTMYGMTELEAPLSQWVRARREGSDETTSETRFSEAATALAERLGERTWLLGDQFTVADVVCIGVLGMAASRELLTPWPVLERTSRVAKRARLSELRSRIASPRLTATAEP